MIVKDRPQASQRPTVTLKTLKDVSLACIMYNTLPNVFRLQRRALSICYPIFLGDRQDEGYYGTCVQHQSGWLSGCDTEYNGCKNGGVMKDFGGFGTCCCHCCRDGWCSHNTENHNDCPGAARPDTSRALMNVTRGEETTNQITNIDE